MALYSDNLYSLRGAVKEVKPNASTELIDRSINKRIREVVNGRDWYDLTKIITIPIPDQYATGTVAVTQNSNVVTGTGTGWPVADDISTIGPVQVRQPGVSKVKPASMVGIYPGKWLLVDSANITLMEAVAVESAGDDYFVARFRNTHDAGFTITASSLASRQFRIGFPIYTVTAVVNATTIWLDMNWGGEGLSAQSYQIVYAYARPDPYCRRVKLVFDPLQGIPLNVDMVSYEDLIRSDPQLSASQDPQMMVAVPPGIDGTARWLLYPIQSSARAIVTTSVLTWPLLIQDGDRPPPFINPEVFVAGACYDALRVKTIPREGRTDVYYDLEQAMTFKVEFEDYLKRAEDDDEARNPKNLQNWTAKMSTPGSCAYFQSHPGWPTDYQR